MILFAQKPKFQLEIWISVSNFYFFGKSKTTEDVVKTTGPFGAMSKRCHLYDYSSFS